MNGATKPHITRLGRFAVRTESLRP